VPDARMTSSSQWDSYHGPERARINTTKEGEFVGAWVPDSWNSTQWIQVEFDALMNVQKVQTKGRDDFPQWTESYMLLFSEDGEQWEAYEEVYGTAKLFEGNVDSSHVRKGYLARGFTARAVRLHPTAWNNAIGVRWEILGCPGNQVIA
ncbi:hypothetical protein CAPTEDRAFT_92663, partial [Capitella teleta]